MVTSGDRDSMTRVPTRTEPASTTAPTPGFHAVPVAPHVASAPDALAGGGIAPARGRTPIPPGQIRLSVLVPAYNERDTIDQIVDMIRAVPVRKEIICVDDCSTDGTGEALARLLEAGLIDRVIRQPKNRGKGAAIRTALAASTGNVVIVQDADLEYSPADWPTMLEPIVDGRADAVFGSRFLGGPHRVLYFWHAVGNKLLTAISNLFTNLNLTDMETCYKAIRGELARGTILPTLTADRFGFEPEVTARLARVGARIYEVPISYSGRTYAEGKKAGWKDGVAALWHIVKYNVLASGRSVSASSLTLHSGDEPVPGTDSRPADAGH
jgi:glycosyltransferase involved in cell wall biosynthesis